jgi:NAD(P)-dependent dehydrogenase (short-subunit alcohol dehydrogenase family)
MQNVASINVAEIAVAKRRISQARDACRTAQQRLAALAASQDGPDVFAVKTCVTPQDAEAVAALVRAAMAENGRAEVVVMV